MHEISTRKLLSEQSRIRQLFDEDSNFKEVIQIDKYTAIGEVEDGVTNAIGDIAIRHETHYSNHTKARDNTKQGEEESVALSGDLTFQSKKRLRRHISREHVVVGKPACKNCGNLFRTWKDLKVHMYKTHENKKDKEGNKKEIRSMIRNCTGDDMEETTRNIDDEEVNRDIIIKSESQISICEGSAKDYQIKDIRKVEFKHTCSGSYYIKADPKSNIAGLKF